MFARVFLVASLLASFVAAVTEPGLPQCAGDCVGSNFGGCQQLNVQCICTNTKLLTHLACCVSKNCSPADQKKTIDFANAICKGENVSDLPQSATCPLTATGSSATGSSTGSSSGTITTTASSQTTGTAPAPAQASSTSSQGAAAGYERAGGVGLGMVVAGLVAAI